jgi:hypothetical protein
MVATAPQRWHGISCVDTRVRWARGEMGYALPVNMRNHFSDFNSLMHGENYYGIRCNKSCDARPNVLDA